MYDSTDHENYGKEESNFFNIFVESDNGIWQGCLPKDACFMAEIDEDATDADAITFQHNGNVIETRFTFPGYSDSKFKTFVELGECLPVCDAVRFLTHLWFSFIACFHTFLPHQQDTESLLEFDIHVGVSLTSPTWWIRDENDSRVVECDEVFGQCVLQSGGGATRFHRIRHCLPSSQCHLFVASDKFYSVYSSQPNFDTLSFNLTYDGELLANRNGFRFEAIEFGNECRQLACEDNDNDALMELFLIRDNLRSYNLPNLTLQVQDGFDMLLLLQEIPDLAQDTHYYRICLPKDSCLNLTMFVPETYNVTSVRNSSNAFDYFEDGDLRIVFDNVIYRDSDFRFGKTFIGDNEYIFHDTTFFGNCDTFAFCNESELRLDVTLHAPADDNLNQ
jgi:hypothetical protein